MACKTATSTAAKHSATTKYGDVQNILKEFSKDLFVCQELSEESTVVDLDNAAALAHESSAQSSSVSKAVSDIDELASQSQLTDSERKEAWIRDFNRKREKLERVERILLAGYHEDNVGNCLYPTVDDSHEILMEDWQISFVNMKQL